MKNLLNLGTALNKAEQKVVFGGNPPNRLKHEGDDGGCSYEHRDVCTNGTPCDPFDPDSCGVMSAGCGHWVMVC
ncbi:hypothetical protein [Psychroserpens sp. SPM9]|uniref:hypothetical protein n=1 Tax=Psychroserpens sp. SPM9 TaxID=2975598 RepID=UPI0021A437DD|nr:hypothetical protein [Psychroserpens sp. SPM9]MDG5492532.1 hypothetical protein [Psychroserpens sp. SPM9]